MVTTQHNTFSLIVIIFHPTTHI